MKLQPSDGLKAWNFQKNFRHFLDIRSYPKMSQCTIIPNFGTPQTGALIFATPVVRSATFKALRVLSSSEIQRTLNHKPVVKIDVQISPSAG